MARGAPSARNILFVTIEHSAAHSTASSQTRKHTRILCKFSLEDLDIDLDEEPDEGDDNDGDDDEETTTAVAKPKDTLRFRGEDLQTFIKWPEYR